MLVLSRNLGERIAFAVCADWGPEAVRSTGKGEVMQGELEHLLRTHSDHEGTDEQSSLRDILAGLRRLAGSLQLDFGEALAASEAVYEEQLLQEFDPDL
jgi:hypothetical protein